MNAQQGQKPHPKTITITAFNRPHYFKQLLSSLLANDLNGWQIYIQIEPSDKVDEFKSIAAALLPAEQYQLDVNITRLGVRQNPYALLQKVFAQGALVNIYLEEDMVVSSDLTHLATWYQSLNHQDIVCANLMFSGCASAGFISSLDCPTFLVKSKCFNSLGFILTNQQWEQHFEPQWFKTPKYFLNPRGEKVDGWDLTMYNYVLSHSRLKVISPLLARATHTGKEGGMHCSEEFHTRAFENLPIFQSKTHNQNYSIVKDYNTLPYAVKAQLNLWHDMTTCLLTLKRKTIPLQKIQNSINFLKKCLGWYAFKKFRSVLKKKFKKKQRILPKRPEVELHPVHPDSAFNLNRQGVESIPKLIHIVWIGDETKCPHELIETWSHQNPDFTVKVWGNKEYHSGQWHNRKHMKALWKQKCYNGVADMMRFEILYWHGGFTVDADSRCVQALPDWMFDCEAFTCFENEIEKPGLLATGYFASQAKNNFLKTIILSVVEDRKVPHGPAWMTVGPKRLTDVYQASGYAGLTIYPSHYFIPVHYSGRAYQGDKSLVFAEQFWGSTFDSYGNLES
jgi:mannosyltransferase OCH1-like enzyme